LSLALQHSFKQISTACPCDYILVNGLSILEAPPLPLEAYDFQLLQIPLRALLNESEYFNLAYASLDAYQAAFAEACARLDMRLDMLLEYNKQNSLLSFVTNFLVPQQHAGGRLLPRYDLRNPSYFVEQLNQHLGLALQAYKNVYLLDIDQIASSIGRRYVQDDSVLTWNHSSLSTNYVAPQDRERLEALTAIHEAHEEYDEAAIAKYVNSVWFELDAMYRSVAQVDMVKMVLVDLDDTLWRGLLVETGSTDIEGWPLGFVEALAYLKQRGMILGIVSKNTEERIIELWPYQHVFPLSNFAVKRINWNPKPDNIAELLAEVNLLPSSVLYIDDNPVEREAVKQAFPAMRSLGANPYLWRRVLLWSPETQVANVTPESAERSEMIKAQVQRETERKKLSRDEFLTLLDVSVSLVALHSSSDPRFQRAFELLNKTNQFNTTGKRWLPAEAEQYFAEQGVLYVLSVADRFTSYGLVGVLCVKQGQIDQFVMSCRVVGLDVEFAAVSRLVALMRATEDVPVTALSVETDANQLSRSIWSNCGFLLAGDQYVLPGGVACVSTPAHINVAMA
jgi:FkbH-like protein